LPSVSHARNAAKGRELRPRRDGDSTSTIEPPVVVVLAAGSASRFGALKQVAELHGRPLVSWPVRAALQAGIEQVLVTVGHGAPLVQAALAGLPVTFVQVADWERGLGASVQAGLAAAGTDHDVMVLLADQPGIGEAAIRRLVETAPSGEDAVRASFEGRPSHPVLVRSHTLSRIGQLRGDRGLSQVLADASLRLIACDDIATDRDVDLRADLVALATQPPAEPGA
jgi:CTP:molybdopterin cytidylyltransferase MocA